MAITAAALTLLVFVWRPWQTRPVADAAPVPTAAQHPGPARSHASSQLAEETAAGARRQGLATEPPKTAATVAAAAASTSPSSAVAATESPAETNARGLARQLVGTWDDNFYGKRRFTFADDGTAAMVIELDGVGKLLYGAKLSFTLDWSIENDVLTMKMTGGEPADTAKSVAKMFGETSQQRIEAINGASMTLRSLDSQTLYQHRRVEP